jgi:hypothetical protein
MIAVISLTSKYKSYCNKFTGTVELMYRLKIQDFVFHYKRKNLKKIRYFLN